MSRVVFPVAWLIAVTLYVAQICVYIFQISPSNILHNAQFGKHIYSSSYFTIIFEVCIALGCILAQVYKNVGSTCLFSMLAVWLVFAMWQSYFFQSYTPNMCMVTLGREILFETQNSNTSIYAN